MFSSDPPLAFSAAYAAAVDPSGDRSRLVSEDTKIFVSPLFSGRGFHCCAHLTGWLSLLLLLASIPSRPALLASTLCLGLSGAASLFLLRRFLLQPRYEIAVSSGTWALGVYSYSSGDIAVKLPGPLGLLRLRETHIEASSFLRAEAVKGWCLQGGLHWGTHVALHFLAVDATPRKVVCHLQGDPALVAKQLNARKVGVGYSVA